MSTSESVLRTIHGAFHHFKPNLVSGLGGESYDFLEILAVLEQSTRLRMCESDQKLISEA